MCNENEAKTGEHIFKHTILHEMYGRERFKKGNRLIAHAEKEYNGRKVASKKTIESTDSDVFKFKKTLCSNCNGAKSQKWDDEFDLFIGFLLSNWKNSFKNGYINLKDVHPKCSKNDVRNLYNYFCKLFGCVLYSNGLSVPEEIVGIVSNSNYKNVLGINVVYDVELEGVTEFREFLVNHDLTGDDSHELNYRWAIGFGPIKIGFWYKTPPKFIIGTPWYGKGKRIDFTKNV